MHESAGRRLVQAIFFALLAGLVVAFWNPIDHFKADLRADGQGFKFSIQLAAHAIEFCIRRF